MGIQALSNSFTWTSPQRQVRRSLRSWLWHAGTLVATAFFLLKEPKIRNSWAKSRWIIWCLRVFSHQNPIPIHSPNFQARNNPPISYPSLCQATNLGAAGTSAASHAHQQQVTTRLGQHARDAVDVFHTVLEFLEPTGTIWGSNPWVAGKGKGPCIPIYKEENLLRKSW